MLVHPISPTQSSDFCSDPELSVALPPQTSLPLINSLLSTCSLGQLSAASPATPSFPLLQRQGSSGVSGSLILDICKAVVMAGPCQLHCCISRHIERSDCDFKVM